MEQVKFFLKNNNQKAFRFFFNFLLFFHLMAAALLILFRPNENSNLPIYIFAGLFLIAIPAFKFFRRKQIFLIYQLVLFILFSIFWFLQAGFWVMMGCVVLLSLLKILQNKKVSILFSADIIRLEDSLFSKKYLWEQVDFIVLKDGLLSINFKSNKIIQLEIENELLVSEMAFNTKIAAQIAKRIPVN